MSEAVSLISRCGPLTAPTLSDAEAESTAALFKALGDPARVRIVNLLASRGGGVFACEFEPALGLSQPTVSHHLKKLTDAGLLDREQRASGRTSRSTPRQRRSSPASSTWRRSTMSVADRLREQVRERYAEAARSLTRVEGCGCDCDSTGCCQGDDKDLFGRGLYGDTVDEVPDAAALASLGCGNPVAVAELREGETVLDLGSGGGIDVILSAKCVDPSGRAYGLDMTDEMLALAQRNAEGSGVRNAIFLKGVIEDVPLPAASVDVVVARPP